MTSEECRKTRGRLGWSTYRLAVFAGLSERTVVLFETGQRAPRPGTLIALRRAFARAASGAPAV